MKEITINIPDDSSELVIKLVEKLGGSVDKKKGETFSESKRKSSISAKRKNGNPLPVLSKNIDVSVKKVIRNIPKKGTQSNKKNKEERIDHTYLFGKWKDFDIDAKKLREESW